MIKSFSLNLAALCKLLIFVRVREQMYNHTTSSVRLQRVKFVPSGRIMLVDLLGNWFKNIFCSRRKTTMICPWQVGKVAQPERDTSTRDIDTIVPHNSTTILAHSDSTAINQFTTTWEVITETQVYNIDTETTHVHRVDTVGIRTCKYWSINQLINLYSPLGNEIAIH